MYTVQVGRYKGSYSNRFPPFESLAVASKWYGGLNIGNGYKKRLVHTATGNVVARYIS